MAIILDEEDLKFIKKAGLRFFNNEEKYRNAPIRRERGDFEECWVYTDSNYVVFSGTAKSEAPLFDYARKKYPEEFI